jgi:opacity protein-like surface antigen
MSLSQKLTVISAALLFTFSSNALAGDYYPPDQMDDAPEVTVVEFGTGWYLRGDIGYSGTVDPGFSIGGTTFDQDLGNGHSFSFGAGYMINDYLRVEGSMEYTGNLQYNDQFVVNCSVWTITGLCSGEDSVAVAATSVSLNGYVDLGNFRGFTPYVGGGVGITHLNWEDYTYTNRCRVVDVGDCDPSPPNSSQLGSNVVPSNTEWKATGSLMAGFAYDLTKNLKLDIGYKFTYIGGGTVADDIPTTAGFTDLEYDSFNIHQVKVGLRYEIW